jgi:hypothetical protein
MSANSPQYRALGDLQIASKSAARRAKKASATARRKQEQVVFATARQISHATMCSRETFDALCANLAATVISNPVFEEQADLIRAIREAPDVSFNYFATVGFPPHTVRKIVADLQAHRSEMGAALIRSHHTQYPKQTDEPCPGCPGANPELCKLTVEPGARRTFAILIDATKDKEHRRNNAIFTLKALAASLSDRVLGKNALRGYWERITRTPGLFAEVPPVVEVCIVAKQPHVTEHYVEFVLRTSNIKACTTFVKELVTYNEALQFDHDAGWKNFKTLQCLTLEEPHVHTVPTGPLKLPAHPITFPIHDMSVMIGRQGAALRLLEKRLRHANNDGYSRDVSSRDLRVAVFPVHGSPHCPVLVTVREPKKKTATVDNVDIMEIAESIEHVRGRADAMF